MAAKAIRELDPRKCSEIIDEIVRLEKKLFPKDESLARNFHEELRKKNTGLLYMTFGEEEEEEEDGEIVGYVMYSWISSLCASITKLAVKENYRRRGYGEALLKAAIQKCRTRRIQRVCLHVDPTRTPAVRLYKKLGFQIDELVKSYYSSDRNAFRMYVDFTDDN
ncbi:putative transferase transcription regulator GNAT family [Dioscorea sansibarensis]